MKGTGKVAQAMRSIAEQKAELRKAIRQRVREMAPEAAESSNEAVCRRVLEHLDEYLQAKTLFCFVGTNTEIDTAPIILHALNAGKTVAVPLCTEPGIMEARGIARMDDLSPGAYGILEPGERCEVIEPDRIDLAIVPCVSCDRGGGRLGRGSGFYDRFLDGRAFPAVALCREALMVESVPLEPWDLPVDAVVTENNIYRCRSNTAEK